MIVRVCENLVELGRTAAAHGAKIINRCVAERGKARIVLSTGASQFTLFQALLDEAVDWSRVEAFHLDEYIGLPRTHKASFRKYLQERFVEPFRPGRMHFVAVEGDIRGEIERLSADLAAEPIDLGFIGIGENGHIAFNDPPADFITEQPYIVVNLNDTCKDQQVREGWFASAEEVPRQAISMSVNGIMRCESIISCVPGSAKAQAVFDTLTCAVSPCVPATRLREHREATVYLDEASAGLLSAQMRASYAQ